MSENERREVPRQASSFAGQIRLGAQLLHHCVVTDWSPKGARVLIDDAKAVPESFILYIAFLGTSHASRVIWRSATELGVTFEA